MRKIAQLRASSTARNALYLGAIVLFFIFLPWWVGPYYGTIFVQVFLNVILAVTLRAIFNIGQLNVAHLTFMGFGAYTVAMAITKAHLSFWLALPLGGLVTALLALAVGYSTLRIKGIYFVIITLGFAEFIRLLMGNSPTWVLGGWTGITWIPQPSPIRIPGLFTADFSSCIPYYYLAFILTVLTLFVFYRIDHSRVGSIFQAVRESESLAESVGINTMKYKVLAFVIASLFAGLAGGFYASYFRNVTPNDFSLWHTIPVILYMVVGGIKTVTGPVIGATVITLLFELLKPLKYYLGIATGFFLIFVILLAPGGIEGGVSKLRKWIAARQSVRRL